MHRSLSVLTTSLAATGAVALAAGPAHAATAKSKLPVVTGASPMSLAVGQTLTLRGSALRMGKARTSVVFQRPGGTAVFARATSASRTRLTVVVPSALEAQLKVVDGLASPTRFQLRVLTTRFSKGFTAPKLSPVVGPPRPGVTPPAAATVAPAAIATPVAAPAAVTTTPRPTEVVTPQPETTAQPEATTPADPTTAPEAPTTTTTQDVTPTPGSTTPTPPPACVTTAPDGDADGDGLSNATEAAIKTDPCTSDTDGDGVSDYFEQRSALDLNSAALPYPGKRPYPNALDRTDAGTDFDGDGLTLAEESAAWVKTGAPKVLTYSDGTQFTGGLLRVGAMPGEDYDRNGVLSDDEKDVDDDGIGNWEEQHGGAQPAWWAVAYPRETPYAGRTFLGLDYLDADTDGDGVKDGADDEDHDGFTNAQELVRADDWADTYVSTAHDGTDPAARVNPFNPCKPYFSSKCHTHPPFGAYEPGEDWASPIHADGP